MIDSQLHVLVDDSNNLVELAKRLCALMLCETMVKVQLQNKNKYKHYIHIYVQIQGIAVSTVIMINTAFNMKMIRIL